MTATDGDVGFAECVGVSVRPVITYSCDPNATTPYFNLTTTDYCSYNVYVYTDLLCTAQNIVPISPNDTGSSSLTDAAEAGIIIAVIAAVVIIIFIILAGRYCYRRSYRGPSSPIVMSSSNGAGVAIQLGGDFIRQRDSDEEQK